MIQLTIRVVCNDPATSREICLAKIESNRFDPGYADDQIVIALDTARAGAGVANLVDLRVWKPEVSISLVANEEAVRPSMHLTSRTLELLSIAGASLDFDPYV